MFHWRASVKCIASNHEHVSAIAGDTAVSPNPAAHGCRCPGHYIGRIVDVHAYNPAMIVAAVTDIRGASHVHAAAYQSQRTSVFLHRGIKRNAVVVSGGIYVNWPSCVDGARIHVEREDEMPFGNPAIWCGEGIDKQRATRGLRLGSR